MPERALFTASVPVPRFRFPVPEQLNPPFSVIPLPVQAAIMPWQLTKSGVTRAPVNPCPGDTRNVVPVEWTRPRVLKPAKLEVPNPLGKIKSDWAPRLNVRPPTFCHVPLVRSNRQSAESTAGIPPPSKVPWLTSWVPTCKVPPVSVYLP